MPSAFPSELAVSTVRRPPLCLRRRVHPLVSFTPLQSPPVPCPPSASRRQAPSLGSAFPLRDISLRRLLRDGESILRHLAVFGVSHALDGFFRRWPCGFISPHSHVQGFPTGVHFLSHSRPQLVAEVVPSRRFVRAPLPTVTHERHVTRPRPQGFPSVRESATAATVFSRRLGPIPSWASPPPGSLSRRRGNAFTSPAARGLVATLSSHCHHRPSASRRRAWLVSLETADLLEVLYLPARPSCPDRSDEVHRSASTGLPLLPPFPPCGPVRPPTAYGFRDLARAVPTREPTATNLRSFGFR